MKIIRIIAGSVFRFEIGIGGVVGRKPARASIAPANWRPTLVPKTKRAGIGLAALFLGSLLAISTGCSSVQVQPWQRATLADYTMRPDRDPLGTAAAEHTFYSRESATGGRGVGGAGCGCN